MCDFPSISETQLDSSQTQHTSRLWAIGNWWVYFQCVFHVWVRNSASCFTSWLDGLNWAQGLNPWPWADVFMLKWQLRLSERLQLWCLLCRDWGSLHPGSERTTNLRLKSGTHVSDDEYDGSRLRRCQVWYLMHGPTETSQWINSFILQSLLSSTSLCKLHTSASSSRSGRAAVWPPCLFWYNTSSVCGFMRSSTSGAPDQWFSELPGVLTQSSGFFFFCTISEQVGGAALNVCSWSSGLHSWYISCCKMMPCVNRSIYKDFWVSRLWLSSSSLTLFLLF